MVIFLLFVALIVIIFSDEYSMSGLNQMLATVMTGVLPYLIKTVLIKKHADLDIDTDDVNFLNSLEKVINCYEQNWPIDDIDVKVNVSNQGIEMISGMRNGEGDDLTSKVQGDVDATCFSISLPNKGSGSKGTEVKIDMTKCNPDTIIELGGNVAKAAEADIINPKENANQDRISMVPPNHDDTDAGDSIEMIIGSESEADIVIYIPTRWH